MCTPSSSRAKRGAMPPAASRKSSRSRPQSRPQPPAKPPTASRPCGWGQVWQPALILRPCLCGSLLPAPSGLLPASPSFCRHHVARLSRLLPSSLPASRRLPLLFLAPPRCARLLPSAFALRPGVSRLSAFASSLRSLRRLLPSAASGLSVPPRVHPAPVGGNVHSLCATNSASHLQAAAPPRQVTKAASLAPASSAIGQGSAVGRWLRRVLSPSPSVFDGGHARHNHCGRGLRPQPPWLWHAAA